MGKVSLKIKGMHCKGCELGLEQKLEELEFINKVKADYKKSKVDIEYNLAYFDLEKIKKVIRDLGFEVIP